MRKTARTVVWEGAGAQSPAPDPIGRRDARRYDTGVLAPRFMGRESVVFEQARPSLPRVDIETWDKPDRAGPLRPRFVDSR